MAAISLHHVTFSYASQPTIQNISFGLPGGKFLTILGPSGCGKSTLLKIIGGYLAAQSSRISVSGQDVTRLAANQRGMGMVFQNYALFPHLSAWKNVAFGLEVRRLPRLEIAQRVDSLLALVGLSRTEWQRYPEQLSGGQQQRVALARALVIQPSVLLLDEPFANLDRHLREQLRGELRRIQVQTGTTILVTHDQQEALALSDCVAAMRAGRLIQVGSPYEVYQNPRTPFVARALGDANILPGSRLVRPEQITLDGDIPGVIQTLQYQGADVVMEVECEGGSLVRVRVRHDRAFTIGNIVQVRLPADCWHIPEVDDAQ